VKFAIFAKVCPKGIELIKLVKHIEPEPNWVVKFGFYWWCNIVTMKQQQQNRY